MTRLLTILMIMAGLTVPAAAQDTATDDSVASETAETEAIAAEEGDDDDDEEEESGGGEGVYEATGKYDFGFAGVLAHDNRSDLAPLTLASGQPVAGGEYTLKSGGYYRIDINADGSQELALSGAISSARFGSTRSSSTISKCGPWVCTALNSTMPAPPA